MTETQPRSGWKRKIAARKAAVHGRSKSARTTPEPIAMRSASRSRSAPGAGRPRAAASRLARKTRGASVDWSRAAMRPITRERANSRSQ